jgi:hypothetical protein
MRDTKITIRKYDNILVTVARTAPLETKIICKNNNGIIETLSVLKQRASDVLGTTPTVPRTNNDVPSFF